MEISQKRLKEIIIESKYELKSLQSDIKSSEERVKNIYELLTSIEKELHKSCKHKNRSTEWKIVSRRMDYLDWEEPCIFYTCLDCGRKS